MIMIDGVLITKSDIHLYVNQIKSTFLKSKWISYDEVLDNGRLLDKDELVSRCKTLVLGS